jgi:hypothetical protein
MNSVQDQGRISKQRCNFFNNGTCKYGNECFFVHATESEWKKIKESNCLLIEEKLKRQMIKDKMIEEDKIKHEIHLVNMAQQKKERIEKKNEEELEKQKTRNNKCVCVKFTFYVQTCEDWGSGCGCDYNECNEHCAYDDIIHENKQSNCLEYIWIDPKYIDENNLNAFKNEIESYTRFVTFYNFIGSESGGKIEVEELYICKITNNFRINDKEDIEYQLENNEYVIITDGLCLPFGYCTVKGGG